MQENPFRCIPFHPFVDPKTGRVDFRYVLMQVTLHNPNLETPDRIIPNYLSFSTVTPNINSNKERDRSRRLCILLCSRHDVCTSVPQQCYQSTCCRPMRLLGYVRRAIPRARCCYAPATGCPVPRSYGPMRLLGDVWY
eukprot:2425530-Rhodomonas_salina.1